MFEDNSSVRFLLFVCLFNTSVHEHERAHLHEIQMKFMELLGFAYVGRAVKHNHVSGCLVLLSFSASILQSVGIHSNDLLDWRCHKFNYTAGRLLNQSINGDARGHLDMVGWMSHVNMLEGSPPAVSDWFATCRDHRTKIR